MNDTTKTILTVAAAAALLGAVWLTRPTPISSATFSDEGEVFSPEFTDPLAARSLEVVSFDGDTAAYRAFNVEFKDGRWVIPSHHNYPADAETKMADAASALIGLTKDQVVTDRAADHQALGVLAPDDETAPLTGRGTRVTIRGHAGSELTSLIIGNAVPLQPGAQGASTRRYVRIPGKNRVYAVQFDKTFSTKFTDWVETDLLELGSKKIDRIIVDRYTIDEAAGRRTAGESVTLTRETPDGSPTTAGTWALDAQPGGPPGEGEEIDAQRVEQLVQALRGLKITGVRTKPASLAAALGGETQSAALSTVDLLSLQSRGFFVSGGGQLLANEGQITATAEDGVEYTLWFGEAVSGSEEDVSAGFVGEDEESAAESAAAEGGVSRYLFITARFDETFLPAPAPPEPLPPDDEGSAAADAIQGPPGPDGAPPQPAPEESSAESEDAGPRFDPMEKAAYDAKVAARTRRIEEGSARAQALAKRFADWYYVIDGSSFDSLRPSRSELVKEVEAPAAGGESNATPPSPFIDESGGS